MTTDFADHTVEKRPDSKHPRNPVPSVVEVFVVQSALALDANWTHEQVTGFRRQATGNWGPEVRDAKHLIGTIWDASMFGFASQNKSC